MNQPVTSPSSIARVDVYRRRALVARRIHLQHLPADAQHTLRVPDLPLTLLEDSLRLTVTDGQACVIDLALEWELPQADTPLRDTIDEQIADLERQREQLRTARARAKEQLALLRLLQPHPQNPTTLPDALAFHPRRIGEGLFAATDYQRDEGRALRAELRSLGQRLAALEEQIDNLRAQRAGQSNAPEALLVRCRRAARIVLAAGPAGRPVALELSYVLGGAAWVPEYELRVRDEDDGVELAVHAQVAQRTGEDWQQVRIAFSTADLQRTADVPQLQSWRIGKRQEAAFSGWRELPDTMRELFGDWDAGRPAAPSAPPPPLSTHTPLPAMPDIPRLNLRELAVDGRAASATGRSAESSQTIDDVFAALDAPPHPDIAPSPAAAQEESAWWSDRATGRTGGLSMPAFLRREATDAPTRQSRGRRTRRDADSQPEAPDETTRTFASMHESFDGGAEAAATEGGVTADRRALDYGGLRMCGPEEGDRRGRLQRRSLRRRLGELSAEAADDGLVAGIEAALRAAASEDPLQHVTLPRHAVRLEASRGHFATRYEKEGPADVLADGRLQSLMLFRAETTAERIHQCTPAIDTNVYLTARFANPLDMPLLAGPLRVYRDGDFVATAALATAAAGAPLSVNLGVEPGIRVARNVHYHESTTRLRGATVLTHRIEIDVHNRRARPVRLEVFERVPHTEEGNVRVTMTHAEPAPIAYDQRERGEPIRGGWRFDLTLDPQQKRRCVLEYEIQLPSGSVLQGGNRRD